MAKVKNKKVAIKKTQKKSEKKIKVVSVAKNKSKIVKNQKKLNKTKVKKVVLKKKPLKKKLDSKKIKENKKSSKKVLELKKNKKTAKKAVFVLNKKKIKLSKKVKTIKSKKFQVKKDNFKHPELVKTGGVKLHRSLNNPIIEPRPYNWESKATFNPAAFLLDGVVHIIYRAIGDDDVSVLGYAMSFDGYHVEERPTYSVYRRYTNPDKSVESIDYVSGGGWSGGCEDPRVTVIDGRVYVLFNAFDGWGSLRVGMVSMSVEDFKKKKWNWSPTLLLSPEGERHKNWVMFPEKINGKFAILHNLHTQDPSVVRVDYFDDLSKKTFDNFKFESPDPNALPNREISWHSRMRSVGPPPIKTELGWLLLYHATEKKDPGKYKLGAMILDEKDPSRVLYRSARPILEPDESYENEGWKSGVVYSCGAVVKYNRLFVYYGGADTVVCVASIKMRDLLDHLKKNEAVKLKKINTFKVKKK